MHHIRLPLGRSPTFNGMESKGRGKRMVRAVKGDEWARNREREEEGRKGQRGGKRGQWKA